MSVTEKRQVLSFEIDDKAIAHAVSQALHQEYAQVHAAIKWIARTTGISAGTVAKWYRGANAPKSAHLLILLAHYPQLLRSICKLIGREDMWHAAIHSDIPQSMHARLSERHPTLRARGDRFVTSWTKPHPVSGTRLNQRQLWFIEQLRGGHKLQTKDISISWRVHPRTAKRDIAGLVGVGMIRFQQEGKAGWYEYYETPLKQ